mgnify:CR=1 FL=1
MNYQATVLSSLFGLMLGASATAQELVLPSHADVADGHHAVSLPFGSAGFRTQLVVDAAAIAPAGAVLQELRLRADRTSLPLVGSTIPNVVVSLSHTNRTVGNLDVSFANNVTAATTVVFQGSVGLPGHTDGFAGPMPWDITVPFGQPFVFDVTQGNLLIDIVANNPAGRAPSFWLDAMEAGGAATSFGEGGDVSSGDNLGLLVATGNSLDPRLITLGRTIDYITTLSFSNSPGVLALGTVRQATPIHLGPIGAPRNLLYIDPVVLIPHAWTQSFIGWNSTFSLTLPNLPSLAGERVYAQSMIFDSLANPLGMVLSPAMETRVGDPFEVLPMQQLDADDPQAATGTILEFGLGSPAMGAVPIRLEGVFF